MVRPLEHVNGLQAPHVTHKQHIKHWIGNRPMAVCRQNTLEGTRLAVGRCDRHLMDFKSEIHTNAQLIYETHCSPGQPVNIFFSGGLDSEVMLRAFVEQGIPYKCHILYYEGINDQEVKSAYEYCSRAGIKPKVYDFDMYHFFESGVAINFGKFYECSHLPHLSILWHVQNYTQGPVALGGEPILQKRLNEELFIQTGKKENKWYIIIDENDVLVTFRYSAYTKVPVIFDFFAYTPESTLAYLTDPDVMSVIHGSSKNNFMAEKSKLYANYWDIKARPKYYTLERARRLFFDAAREINSVLPVPNNNALAISCEDAIKQLW